MYVYALVSLISLATFSTTYSHRSSDILTFNAGLISLVENYESRRHDIPEAVLNQDADIMCLQEIRHEYDMISIMEKVKDKYTFSYSMFHKTTFTKLELNRFKTQRGTFKPFPCAHASFTPFVHCMSSDCGSLTGLALQTCTLENCPKEIFALPQDCLTCIASSATSFQNIQDKCVSTKEKYNRFSPEGVLLLSKRPLFFAKKFTFMANIKQINLRGLVDGYVWGVGKVSCMHLTADFLNDNGVPLPYIEGMVQAITGIDSYEKQQFHEVSVLLQRYRSYRLLILAGDFNIGPAIAANNVKSAGGDNYRKLVVGGHFDNLYVGNKGHCTYCEDNDIADNVTLIIDHVLTRGVEQISAERVLDDGETPVSDHYGVKVNFRKRGGYVWW